MVTQDSIKTGGKSPASENIKRKGDKRTKIRQQHVGGGRRVTQRKQASQFSHKLKIAGCICCACGLIALTVVLVLTVNETESAASVACEAVASPDIEADQFQINLCNKLDCKFDTTVCSHSCPFGREEDKDGCAISCECGSTGTFEGDIYFDPDTLPELLKTYFYDPNEEALSVYGGGSAAAPSAYDNRWPLSQDKRILVPYHFGKNIRHIEHVSTIQSAAEWLANNTCIDLFPLPDEELEKTPVKAHLLVIIGNGCTSKIGKISGQAGYQHLSLGVSCYNRQVALHELLHTMGFYHEQARSDRDAYIDIDFNNLPPDGVYNYRKIKEEKVVDLGFEYDFDSLMHYTSHTFALPNKLAFVKKSDGEPLLRNDIYPPSDTDIAELHALYKCQATEVRRGGFWAEWSSWSGCTHRCGLGYHSRYRKCLAEDGKYAFGCPGWGVDAKSCQSSRCEGTFLDWGPWAPCSKSCNDAGITYRILIGIKQFVRIRDCDPVDTCLDHVQLYFQSSSCNDDIDCNNEIEITSSWQTWSHWELCARNFGDCIPGSKKRRTRACLTNLLQQSQDCPPDEFGSVSPTGLQIQEFDCICTNPFLEGQGNWTAWGEWSSCTATCLGSRTRIRSCNTTIAKECLIGEPTQTEECGKQECDEVTGYFGNGLVSDAKVCLYGKLISGYLNNDRRKDLLCHYEDGWVRLYFASPDGRYPSVSWEGKTVFCKFSENMKLNYLKLQESYEYVADLNGDGMDDLLCHLKKRSFYVVLFNKGGRFESKHDWLRTRHFCNGGPDILAVHDINGDLKADLICGDHRNGFKEILLNTYN
ncbi:zinc metalloproteinase nas-36-like [Clavelina lepadiformis]|uniref:zinc metalloproteinase nas-36-like n=1 Tax=Clavelina lepadiformis TaxID=159417 RepID=UPI00404289BC